MRREALDIPKAFDTIVLDDGDSAMLLVRSCLAAVAGSILSAGPFVVQADDATPITQLEETLDPQANVALSDRVLGVIEQTAFDDGFEGLGISLEAYANGSSRLCMRYRSRNGLYNGQQDFEIAGRGWTGVPFETDYADALGRLGGTGLGIKALTAADCDDLGATSSYAPVRRRGSSNTDFYLIVHTDRNQASIVVYPEGGSSPVSQRCTKLGGSGSIAYDAKCPLRREAFEDGAKTVLVIRLPSGELRREPVQIVPF